jgi:ribonuclease P protein component
MGDPGEGAAGRRGSRRRLSRSAEFDRVFREGRARGGRHLVLHAFPRADATGGPEPSGPRLGVSVGRRVGGAVERNRVKRLVRESFWTLAPELPPHADYVVVARPEAAELARTRGRAGFDEALAELMFPSESDPR